MGGVDALVLGGAGLVGVHVVAALGGRSVVATARTGTPTLRELDVTDAGSIRALARDARPKAIVVAAAVADAERCEEDPAGSAAVNVGAAVAAAAAAAEVDARLVVFSSEYVFAGGGGRYREGDAVAPINEYGRQKVAVERAASQIPRHLIVRTSGVFGWETACKNFVCRLVRTLRAGGPAVVPSDQVITPTYAPDLAAAVVELIDRDAQGVVHVTGPRTVERVWLGRAVAWAFGLDEGSIEGRPSSTLGYRATRPRECGLDDTLMRDLLGHQLRGAEEALADMRRTEPIRSSGPTAPGR